MGKSSIHGVLVLLLMSAIIDITARDILVHNVDPGQYLRYRKSRVWTQPLSDTLSQTTAESWRVKLRVSGQVMEFRVDAEAEVTAISETAFRAMREQTLKTPTKTLYGPAHSAC